MKRLSLFLFLLLQLVVSAFAYDLPEYEIRGAGITGAQGTYVVDITVTAGKKMTDEVLKQCAIHGVLFKGFNNVTTRQSQKPLAGSASVEASHPEFFASFFSEGGAALNYADEIPNTRKTVKVDKKKKVSATIVVNKEQLLKDLQEAGVVKGLNSIF